MQPTAAAGRHRRRLRALGAHLRDDERAHEAGLVVAADSATTTIESAQGLGIRSTMQPPSFTPDQHDECVAFFREHGYAVMVDAYSQEEVSWMNALWDRSQKEEPEMWGIDPDGAVPRDIEFHHPLLDFPELDGVPEQGIRDFVRHPSSFPLVETILGGKGRPRWSEFNFRETQPRRGKGMMGFHFDMTPSNTGTMMQRFQLDHATQSPDYICTIHYLTDVPDGRFPAFAVVPKSFHCTTLEEAQELLGDEYEEKPLFAPAGSCIFYDIALFHTRLDSHEVDDSATHGRRTIHEYFSRGGFQQTDELGLRPPAHSLTDWNLIPERLAMHPDPEARVFFSHWNSAMAEWAAHGFPELQRVPGPNRPLADAAAAKSYGNA